MAQTRTRAGAPSHSARNGLASTRRCHHDAILTTISPCGRACERRRGRAWGPSVPGPRRWPVSPSCCRALRRPDGHPAGSPSLARRRGRRRSSRIGGVVGGARSGWPGSGAPPRAEGTEDRKAGPRPATRRAGPLRSPGRPDTGRSRWVVQGSFQSGPEAVPDQKVDVEEDGRESGADRSVGLRPAKSAPAPPSAGLVGRDWPGRAEPTAPSRARGRWRRWGDCSPMGLR